MQMAASEYKDKIAAEMCSTSFYRDVFAEGVATFLLVSIQAALPLTWTRELGASQDAAFAMLIALGMGFVVTVLIEIFGEFGGAQMNPAVSIALCLARKITITKTVLFIIAQCSGSIGGAAFVYAVTPGRYRDSLAATTLGSDVQPWQGVLVEMWLTLILMLAVYGSTNSARRKVYMPSLPIGLAVALDIMAGINHTGSSMNPARSLGPAVVMNIWTDHWVYWVGPILGGILATIIYDFILDRIQRPPAEAERELHQSVCACCVKQQAKLLTMQETSFIH